MRIITLILSFFFFSISFVFAGEVDIQYIGDPTNIMTINPTSYSYNWCSYVASFSGPDRDSGNCSNFETAYPRANVYFDFREDGSWLIRRDLNSGGIISIQDIDSNIFSTATHNPILRQSDAYWYNTMNYGYRIFLNSTFSYNSPLLPELSRFITFFGTGSQGFSLHQSPIGTFYNLPDTINSLWYAPGFGFSTIECNGPLSLSDGSCYSGSNISYYEISDKSFSGFGFDIYTGVFLTYVKAIPDYIISSTDPTTGFTNQENTYRTILGQLSGSYLDFSVFDCAEYGIENIVNNCNVIDVGSFDLNGQNYYLLYQSNNPYTPTITTYPNSSYGITFDRIDTDTNTIYLNVFGDQQQSINYTDIWNGVDNPELYSGITIITGNTFSAPDYFATDNIVYSSGFDYTGNIFTGKNTGNFTNLFGGTTLSGNIIIGCPSEYLNFSFYQLPLSEIPVISLIYSVTDFVSVTLPDVDILSPFNCIYGAYNYGLQNTVSSFVPATGSISMFTYFSPTSDKENATTLYLNFLLSIPYIYLAFKILK